MLDLIGIGIGPFNLSLAALLDKQPTLKGKFFEQKPNFDWHKGMILPHTTLQVPFMADLVTLIDPTSQYSFLNYLHHQHRLLKFYFLEDFKIFRQEYNHYCQWVAAQLDSLVFDAQVQEVSLMEDKTGYVVQVYEQGETKTYHVKNLIIGTGTQATLPDVLQPLADQAPHRCMHTADFADNFDYKHLADSDSETLPKVLVLGSGQSSAEVYRALFDQQFDQHNQPKFQLDWVTRSAGFFPMEYSPLGLEHFSPAYTHYFHHLPDSTKHSVLQTQDLLYKGMGFSTITDIYSRLYERSIANQPTYSKLIAHCELSEAKAITGSNTEALSKIQLTLNQREQQHQFVVDYDCIIAGTGYRHGLPRCLDSLADYIKRDAFDQPQINLDYSLVLTHTAAPKAPQDMHGGALGQVFVQNQEIHSHGIGAPDLGLGAHRAGCIINQLQGEQVYDTQGLTVFQDFGVSTDALLS